MIGTDDGFGAFVEKMGDGGGFKCKFCGQIFAATTSITRFKWHWSGVEGRGVKICAHVTPAIQAAAIQAIQQSSTRKRKNSSIMMNPISTTTPGQINQVGNLMGDPERMQMQMQQGVLGEERGAGNDMENMTGGRTQSIDTSTSFSVDRLIGAARQATVQVSQVDIGTTDWQTIASIGQSKQGGTGGGPVHPVTGARSSREVAHKRSVFRCGKSYRLQRINDSRPDQIEGGNFTREEEDTIIKLHEMLGKRWSAIAARLPGRTDNEIEEVWDAHLEKRQNPNLAAGSDQSQEHGPILSQLCSSDISCESSMDAGSDSFPEIDEDLWSEVWSADNWSTVSIDSDIGIEPELQFPFPFSPPLINDSVEQDDVSYSEMDDRMDFWYDVWNSGTTLSRELGDY